MQINKFEHSVIISFKYGIEELEPIHELEDKLREIIEKNKVGEHDGHEIAIDSSHGILYMYGDNAELLFKCVKPILEATDFMKEASAQLRFGAIGTNAPEIQIEI